MTTERQEILPFFQVAKEDAQWMVALLQGRDWLTAAEVLRAVGAADTEGARRRLRASAEASAGRIAGGQRGYKLVEEMTREEFGHFRNWMLSQAGAMQRRIVAADRVWYARNAVELGA
jgi:hypothetical protein